MKPSYIRADQVKPGDVLAIHHMGFVGILEVHYSYPTPDSTGFQKALEERRRPTPEEVNAVTGTWSFSGEYLHQNNARAGSGMVERQPDALVLLIDRTP